MTNMYTAVSRINPSRAMKFLDSKKLLIGDVLDFGCGRGFDVRYYGIDGYDPNWGPSEFPKKKYDTIACNWVLNVVSEEEQNIIIKQIKSLLKPNGKAYITVRRDIKEGYLVKDYQQRLVYLNLESIEKNSAFEIYVMNP
jgi:ATP adenylyltransferase